MRKPDADIIEALRYMLDAECGPEVVSRAEDAWPAQLWQVLEQAALPRAWVPESLGGAGADWPDGLGIVRTAASYAAPVPLAETLLAGRLLSRCEMPVPAGPLNVALPQAHESIEMHSDGRFSGRLERVGFGRHLRAIVVCAGETLALLAEPQLEVTPGVGLDGEPLDAIEFSKAEPSDAKPVDSSTIESVRRLGATLRCFQIAGALEHVLSRSIEYAGERNQFGRPISKFQAVQHNLAELAGEASAAAAAANAAGSAIESHGVGSELGLVAVASAKIRCGQAASRGAAIAHQVHGAMGFAREYPLHHFTRRLWTWRDDFGAETEWAEALGLLVARNGPDALWPTLTAL